MHTHNIANKIKCTRGVTILVHLSHEIDVLSFDRFELSIWNYKLGLEKESHAKITTIWMCPEGSKFQAWYFRQAFIRSIWASGMELLPNYGYVMKLKHSSET